MDSWNKYFLPAVLIAALLIGCGNTEPDEVDNSETEITVEPAAGMDLYGQIRDTAGNPVKGVVVSEGTYNAVTDADGVYQLKRNPAARFVYYSTPSEFEINVESGCSAALFYAEIPAGGAVYRHDFVLKKRSSAVSAFKIVGIGDPQVNSDAEQKRFADETMADVSSFLGQTGGEAVILVMGDVVEDSEPYFDGMKKSMGSTGVPVFTTVGNHDKLAGETAEEPKNATAFSSRFGPVDYSFNIGKTLFICMDNVLFTNGTDYGGGFTDAQVSWLESHIASADNLRMVVFFYHIPLRNHGYTNRDKITNLLSRFHSLHMMSGHTHRHENYEGTSPMRYEHVHGAACGAWWHSNICTDGSPNGYAVYDVEGLYMKDWYYKGTNRERDFQLRLYRGDAFFGSTKTNYSFDKPSNSIVANVWNTDSMWKVEVWEDGTLTGYMSRMTENPRDAWAVGLHVGHLGLREALYDNVSKNLYYYELKKPAAAIEVVAVDRFGRRYTQDSFTTDFTDGLKN